MSEKLIKRGGESQPGPPELSPGLPVTPSLAPPSENSCHQLPKLLGAGDHSGGVVDVDNANAQSSCTPHNSFSKEPSPLLPCTCKAQHIFSLICLLWNCSHC